MKLTKEEYRILLKLIYLGNWVIEGGSEELDENSPESNLEQKILKMAEEYQCEADVGNDNETKSFGYTEKFEEDSGIFEIIENYNEELLVDELSAHFARKEFVNKNKDKLDAISDAQAEEAISKLVEKYLKYFTDNGLESLRLDNI